MDCSLGGAVFRLQNYYVKDWVENFMMKFEVDNVQAWYEHANKVISNEDFGSTRHDEPETVGNTKIITHLGSMRRAAYIYPVDLQSERGSDYARPLM